MSSLLFLVLLLPLFSCSQIPSDKTEKSIAHNISLICTDVIDGHRTFPNLVKFKEAIVNQFDEESDKDADQLFDEIIDEIEKISHKGPEIDPESLIFIAQDLMKGNSERVIRILHKRSFQFSIFFMDMMGSVHQTLQTQSNLTGKGINEDQRRKILIYGSVTRDSISKLILLKDKVSRYQALHINLLIRKLELEWLKVLSKKLSRPSL